MGLGRGQKGRRDMLYKVFFVMWSKCQDKLKNLNILKNITFPGSRWKVKELTYKISKYPSTQRLSKPQVDKEIEKALKVWSDVTDLTFEQRRTGKVHIDIRFESFHHGDGDPFDGVGGTLAHAFFPVSFLWSEVVRRKSKI